MRTTAVTGAELSGTTAPPELTSDTFASKVMVPCARPATAAARLGAKSYAAAREPDAPPSGVPSPVARASTCFSPPTTTSLAHPANPTDSSSAAAAHLACVFIVHHLPKTGPYRYPPHAVRRFAPAARPSPLPPCGSPAACPGAGRSPAPPPAARRRSPRGPSPV